MLVRNFSSRLSRLEALFGMTGEEYHDGLGYYDDFAHVAVQARSELPRADQVALLFDRGDHRESLR